MKSLHQSQYFDRLMLGVGPLMLQKKTMGLGSKFVCGLLMEIVSGKTDWLSILTVRRSAGVTLRSISKDYRTRARKHESGETKVDAT